MGCQCGHRKIQHLGGRRGCVMAACACKRFEDPRDPSMFDVQLVGAGWDVHLGDALPPGVVVLVRDYRLAEYAEAGTAEIDEQGRPYFGWTFGAPDEARQEEASACA